MTRFTQCLFLAACAGRSSPLAIQCQDSTDCPKGAECLNNWCFGPTDINVTVVVEPGEAEAEAEAESESEGETCVPTGIEVCDYVDNDCDGEVDELVNTWWFEDADGDGFGTPDTRWSGCAEGPPPLPGYVLDQSDCNDTSAEAYPGYTNSELWPDYPPQTEICDGLDNDCNGAADEIFRTGSCYGCVGGERVDGVMACQADGRNACSDELGVPVAGWPQPEEICGNHIDDDCSGVTDDGCDEPESCVGEGELCYTFRDGGCEVAPMYTCSTAEDCVFGDPECCSVYETLICSGVCQSGIRTCVDGDSAVCEGQVGADPEICGNGQNDDCDDYYDDDLDPDCGEDELCEFGAPVGTLDATLDSETPLSKIVLAGEENVEMTELRFTATGEDFFIRRLRIKERGADLNGLEPGTYDRSIFSLRLEYPAQDGTTRTQTAVLVAGSADITLGPSSEIYVPADTRVTVTVAATFTNMAEGAVSGDKPQLGFEAIESFEAIGRCSGAVLRETVNRTNLIGSQMILRESECIFALAIGNPTVGIPGLAEVLRFTVAARGNECIFGTVTFKIASTDNNGEAGASTDDWNECRESVVSGAVDQSDFTLYDRSAIGTPLEAGDSDWQLLNQWARPCNGEDIGFARVNLTSPRVIPGGTTRTYSLEVDTTGASSANDDAVRFDIPRDLLSTRFAVTGDEVNEADVTSEAAVFAADDSADGTLDAANFTAGDYLCVDEDNDGNCSADEEIVFVQNVTASDVTVFRGDFGRYQETLDNNSDLLVIPSAIVWTDDGDTDMVNPVSGYLVRGLPLVGNTFVY